MADGVNFSMDAARRIAETVRAHEAASPSKRVRDLSRFRGQNIVEGFYAEYLAAPASKSNPADIVPTTADFYPARGDGEDWEVRENDADKIEVTNRRPDFTAAIGSYGVVFEINGEWRPFPFDVISNGGGGGDGGTSWLGCDITDCLPESSAFMIEKACGGCDKLPLAYELVTGAGTVDDACSIFGYDQRPGVGLIQPHYTNWILSPVDIDDPDNCTYESPEIECDTQLDGRCGNATWTWSTGFRDVNCDQTWVWSENECTGANYFYSQFNITSMTWEWVYDYSDCVCDDGDYSSPSIPTPPPTGDGQTATTSCEAAEPYIWVCEYGVGSGGPDCPSCGASPNCAGEPAGGAMGPPGYSGTTPGEEVTYNCTISVPDETLEGWELTVGCNCGNTDPPPIDGTLDGQTYATRCVQEEGYENPARYKWRLIVDGCDTVLQLLSIAQDDTLTVVWTYEPVAPRCWCCNCTNTMVSRSCGPYPRGFNAPGVICLKPAALSGCPSLGLFEDGAEVEISIPCIDNGAGNGLIFGLSGPVPTVDEFDIPGRYWPGETTATGAMFGFGSPNCTVSCPDDGQCEFHSPVTTVDIDGDEYYLALSMCVGYDDIGGLVVSVWVNIVSTTGTPCGSAKAHYQGVGLSATASEMVLTLNESSPYGPPCGTDYTGWPATITVRKY